MKINRLSGMLLACAAAATLFPLSSAFAGPSADSPATPVLCAVKGEEIKDLSKAAGKADFNGKTYYFCCKNCAAKFTKADDAGKTRLAHLTDLRTERVVLQKKLDAVNAELKTIEQPAAKTEEHHHDASAGATKSAAVSKVYCAITGDEIGTPDMAAGGSSTYKGKTYYFCCAGCKPKFDGDQARYAALADKADADRATK